MQRFICLISLLIAQPLIAQEPKPGLEVRLPSVRDLSGYFEYLAGLGGQAEQGRMVADLVQAFGGAKGVIEGIDLRRPIGAYAVFTPAMTDSQIVLMVPVADEAAALKLLESRLGLSPKDDGDGVHRLDVPGLPVPVFLRFHKDYACITVMDAGHLKPERLIDPARFFADADKSLLSATLHIDRIPAEFRSVALGQLELMLNEWLGQAKAADAAEKLRDWLVIDGGMRAAKTMLDEGRTLKLQLTADPKTDELALRAAFTSAEGGALATAVQSLPSRPARAALVAAGLEHPVVSVALHAGLPDSMLAGFAERVDAMLEEAAARDPAMLGRVFDAIRPTIKAGRYELGAALTGGGDAKLRLLAAMRAVKGKEIETVVREFAGFIPASEAKVELDAAKIDGGALHKVEVINDDLQRLYGSETVWAGITDSLVLLGFGDNSEDLKRLAAATPGTTDMLAVTIAWSRFIPLTLDHEEDAEFLKQARNETFGATVPPGADETSLVVAGGKELTITLKVKGKAVAFLARFDELKKQ